MSSLSYSEWQSTQDLSILAQLAIAAAVCSDWKEATKINQKILSFTKNNVEALNRLAKAHLSLGEKEKAQKLYKQVLTLDPCNIIARKNLEKISKSNGASQSNGKQNGNSNHSALANLSSIFIFEPGKTKTINLLNLAPPATLSSLSCGELVLLNVKKHSITISTCDGIYLGVLPDDLAHKLLTFIAGGNKYEACIKCVTSKSLTVFIREVCRSEKFLNQPSFPDNRDGKPDKDLFFA